MKDVVLPAGRSNEKRSRNGRSHQPVTNEESSSTAIATCAETMQLIEVSEMPNANPPMTMTQAEIDVNQFGSRIEETISKYQDDLHQKDELITALVNELEQAVEQLDRYERVGAERSHPGHPASASNSGSDIAGLKLPFMDNLQRMVEDWEQTQPATQLERIESQLAAVHDLILNLPRTDRPRNDFGNFEDHHRRTSNETAEPTQHEPDNMTLDESSPSWEAIKNQLFAVEPVLQLQSAESQSADSELMRLVSETPTPETVDFNLGNIEDLKRAIVERDAYIIQLNRLFRTRNTLSLPTDWATLASVPGEMQVRIESLIEHLDVQVRLGEVEMSLERARLARERSQIQSEREHIEKHLRRLGLNSIAELDNISQATGSSGDRRWMRFLGPNTK